MVTFPVDDDNELKKWIAMHTHGIRTHLCGTGHMTSIHMGGKEQIAIDESVIYTTDNIRTVKLAYAKIGSPRDTANQQMS